MLHGSGTFFWHSSCSIWTRPKYKKFENSKTNKDTNTNKVVTITMQFTVSHTEWKQTIPPLPTLPHLQRKRHQLFLFSTYLLLRSSLWACRTMTKGWERGRSPRQPSRRTWFPDSQAGGAPVGSGPHGCLVAVGSLQQADSVQESRRWPETSGPFRED